MKNNFECRYKSVGGSYCFYYDSEIGLNGTECNDCEMNNDCEYCNWAQDIQNGSTRYCENCVFNN